MTRQRRGNSYNPSIPLRERMVALGALAPAARLNEHSPLATADNAQKIFREWSRYWDLEKPYLLEKSPPNPSASSGQALSRAAFCKPSFPMPFLSMFDISKLARYQPLDKYV